MDRTKNSFLATPVLPVQIPDSLRYGVISLHAIGVFLPWLSSAPTEIKTLCTTAVVLSGIYFLFYARSMKQLHDIERQALGADDDWQIRYSNGATFDAEFGNSHYISAWLIILCLKWDGNKTWFIFTPVMLDGPTWRRLRVRILHRVRSCP